MEIGQKTRIFATKSEDFRTKLEKKLVTDKSLGAITVNQGLILPIRKNPDYPEMQGEYMGGVCDSNHNFTAGMAINQGRFSCCSSYKTDDEITIRNETVIFGGIFHPHFGITLLLSMSRFWWIAEHPDTSNKIIFLTIPNDDNTAAGYCKTFASLINISEAGYEILDKPTQFSKIIIPEEVLTSTNNDINIRYINPFSVIRDNILSKYGYSPEKKIYLSRRKYRKNGFFTDGQNEEYYENFFEKRGFCILHPQELEPEEQIRHIASAEEIVSTYGTLAHLISLFASPNAKQIMLLRADTVDPWFPAQAAILQMKELDWYIVEAASNPYPTLHDEGSFLYAPTDSFRSFLDAMKITYEEDELTSTVSDEHMKNYLSRWLQCYSSPYGFERLNRPDLFPMMQALTYHITGKLPDAADYPSLKKD